MARTGIKDGREQGPQKNKWGYVNNPIWTLAQNPHLIYNSANEPQVWDYSNAPFSKTGANVHIPCGHWHKS